MPMMFVANLSTPTSSTYFLQIIAAADRQRGRSKGREGLLEDDLAIVFIDDFDMIQRGPVIPIGSLQRRVDNRRTRT